MDSINEIVPPKPLKTNYLSYRQLLQHTDEHHMTDEFERLKVERLKLGSKT